MVPKQTIFVEFGTILMSCSWIQTYLGYILVLGVYNQGEALTKRSTTLETTNVRTGTCTLCHNDSVHTARGRLDVHITTRDSLSDTPLVGTQCYSGWYTVLQWINLARNTVLVVATHKNANVLVRARSKRFSEVSGSVTRVYHAAPLLNTKDSLRSGA